MSGTFPTSPIALQASIKSITPTRISQSHNMKRSVRSIGAQRWAITLDWANLKRAEFAPILAFAIAQRGQYEAFQISVGNSANAQGTWAGTPVCNSGTTVGRSVPLKGLSVGATGKAGDYVKFSGHTKIYMLTADFTADGSGHATATIEPALVTSVADNEAVTVGNLPFTVSFASDIAEYPTRSGGFFDFQASLVEVY